MGIRREIGLVVLGAVLTYIIPNTAGSLIPFFTHIFTLQSIPVDYLSAILGISAIIGLTLIIYHLIQLIRNRKRKSNVTVTVKTANEKLDDLIREIEDFTTRWQEGSGGWSGYRMWIEKNIFVGDKNQIRKFIQHGTNIHTKINQVKKLEISEFKNALDHLTEVTDRLVQLLLEMKRIYWNMDKSKIILNSDPEIPNRIISDGDKICDDLEAAVNHLHILKKHLP